MSSGFAHFLQFKSEEIPKERTKKMKKRRVTQISNRAFLKFQEGHKLLYLKEILKVPSSLLCMINIIKFQGKEHSF